MRKTKIVCTLGPAVDSDEMLKRMMLAGMDCARFNFSHGTYDEHKKRMDNVKRIRRELKKEIPIMLDTKGPEIRLRLFENGSVNVTEGESFVLRQDDGRPGDATGVCISFPDLYKYVTAGTRILADDGRIVMTVTGVRDTDIVCRFDNSGVLKNRKSLNLPGTDIPMKYMSDDDKNDILFGISQDVDFVAASFVRCAEDVLTLRCFLEDNGGGDIKIISKIENMRGIENADDIVRLSDGIMVARGDMGVEVPFSKLPAIQKSLIKKCIAAGKPVITATQMLESMTHCQRPTRAEVSDVANAVYDGTTAIMLSGESAAGEYPVESVRTMAEIAENTEAVINYKSRYGNSDKTAEGSIMNAVANSACAASYQLGAKAIIAFSRKGRSVWSLMRYRPCCPIIAAVIESKACRQLNLAWNVYPIDVDEKNTTDGVLEQGVRVACDSGIVEKGDVVIITGASAIGNKQTDMMKIHTLA